MHKKLMGTCVLMIVVFLSKPVHAKVYKAADGARDLTKTLGRNVQPKNMPLWEINEISEELACKNSLANQLKTVDPVQEKPIVIITTSFNNKWWCGVNLMSVAVQKYSNFKMIYVDDASTDGTPELVEQFIAEYKLHDKITLIKNPERVGGMANIYNAIHQCPDEAIIVCLDGDDFFAHENVISLINLVYQDPNVWLTYGQFTRWPKNIAGYCTEFPKQIIKSRAFRKYKWISSHLRTFYAWLFKQIKKEDLMVDGAFVAAAPDLAFMFPMLEMAADNIKFIPDLLYIYNVANPLNEYKVNGVQQKEMAEIIRSRKKYNQIVASPLKNM